MGKNGGSDLLPCLVKCFIFVVFSLMVLFKYREKFGDIETTFMNLITAFYNAHRMDLVNSVIRLIEERTQGMHLPYLLQCII